MSVTLCISDSKMAFNYIYMVFLVVYKLGIQKLNIKRIKGLVYKIASHSVCQLLYF